MTQDNTCYIKHLTHKPAGGGQNYATTVGFQRRHWWFVITVTKRTFLDKRVLLRHLCDVHVRRRTEITEALKQNREQECQTI